MTPGVDGGGQIVDHLPSQWAADAQLLGLEIGQRQGLEYAFNRQAQGHPIAAPGAVRGGRCIVTIDGHQALGQGLAGGDQGMGRRRRADIVGDHTKILRHTTQRHLLAGELLDQLALTAGRITRRHHRPVHGDAQCIGLCLTLGGGVIQQ